MTRKNAGNTLLLFFLTFTSMTTCSSPKGYKDLFLLTLNGFSVPIKKGLHHNNEATSFNQLTINKNTLDILSKSGLLLSESNANTLLFPLLNNTILANSVLYFLSVMEDLDDHDMSSMFHNIIQYLPEQKKLEFFLFIQLLSYQLNRHQNFSTEALAKHCSRTVNNELDSSYSWYRWTLAHKRLKERLAEREQHHADTLNYLYLNSLVIAYEKKVIKSRSPTSNTNLQHSHLCSRTSCIR